MCSSARSAALTIQVLVAFFVLALAALLLYALLVLLTRLLAATGRSLFRADRSVVGLYPYRLL